MNTETNSSEAREWVTRLSSRLRSEKNELVLFLIELADFDRRKLGIELGYMSTMACLMGELGLTESSACRRIAAARLLARFPAAGPLLLENRLTLTTLVVLKDALSDANASEVFERAAGLSEPEVRGLIARMGAGARGPDAPPAYDVDDLATGPSAGAEVPGLTDELTPQQLPPVATPLASAPDEDLTPITLWVGREFRDELARVRDLLSHSVPSGRKEEVLLHVLKQVRRLQERRRFGSPKTKPIRVEASPAPSASPVPTPATPNAETASPASSSSPSAESSLAVESSPTSESSLAAESSAALTGRTIPAPMRREVYDRDGGRCTYVGPDGVRCNGTWQLELQHIVPYACGGEPKPWNLTLHCRAHNQLRAEKDFGRSHVAARRAQKQATRAAAIAGPTAAPPNPNAADVVSALKNLGYPAKSAAAAVALARERVRADADFFVLIKQALAVLRRRELP